MKTSMKNLRSSSLSKHVESTERTCIWSIEKQKTGEDNISKMVPFHVMSRRRSAGLVNSVICDIGYGHVNYIL